ncbi:MAG: chorismate mutase [Treponema sp.]|nr:chorismate mutase [Treponema sp.]
MNTNIRLYGLRGAVCADNNAESIIKAVCTMCSSLFSYNIVLPENIVSIQFTITSDLTALNPAAALRKGKCGLDVSRCALFCSQEPATEHMLPKTIRVLVTTYMTEGSEPHHVYIQGAEKLRPDFAEK